MGTPDQMRVHQDLEEIEAGDALPSPELAYNRAYLAWVRNAENHLTVQTSAQYRRITPLPTIHKAP